MLRNDFIVANTPFIIRMPNSDDYEEEFNIEGKVTFVAEEVVVMHTTGLVGVAAMISACAARMKAKHQVCRRML